LGVALAALVLLAAPAHAADPVIVAGGDVACEPSSAMFNSGLGTLTPAPGECHQRYTSDLFGGLAPLHLLALGDLQYEDGRRDRFDASYAPSWGRFKKITKPVPGNHEYGKSGRQGEYDPMAAGYFGYFADELAAEGADAGNAQKGWYSFDVPVDGSSWHIVALNSECASGLRVKVGWDGDCDAGSEQEWWLRQDLAADDSDCTIAYWHHPLYTSGGEGPSPAMAPIWNALHDDYADLVLNGHDHDYERFPERGAAPAGTPEPGRGLREIVVGTGGKRLLAPGTVDSTRAVFQNTVYGVLKLTLHGPSPVHPVGWYEWEFIDDAHSGTDFEDKGSADCVSPPRPQASSPGAAPTVQAPPPPARAAVDRVPPVLSGARLTQRRFRLGSTQTARSAVTKAPHGTAATYALSEAATTTLTIDRRLMGRAVRLTGREGRRCVRQSKSNAKRANPRCIVHRRAAALERRQRAGRQTVKLSGRIGRAKLAVGSYRLTLAAKDPAGNKSTRTALTFSVVRR